MTQPTGPRPRARRERGGDLLAEYRPLPGVVDEMVDVDGTVRPHWRPFIDALRSMGRAGVERRFENAERYLRDAGVYYRVYGDEGGDERPWPLSHVPMIVDAGEWAQLERGLVQRAELLESVLTDVYGEGRLVRDGAIPAAAVAGSPEFLRPLVGTTQRGGTNLWLYAADIGRGPDGRFWVLSDRAQAPSGLGYALENRIALSRALPDAYAGFNVRRLAEFFETFRASLLGLSLREDTRPGLLTPGPLNETYFEHAYLARYLGFILVQPDDLVVHGNEVFVRTVAGLTHMDVLLRRLDADFADPLELNSASRIGVPGLVRSVRSGHVAIANALGSGLVESRAMLSFLPALARTVLGEDLILPNVATWWCGQERERQLVVDNFDDLVLAPAFRGPLPGVGKDAGVLGRSLGSEERRRLLDLIGRRGVDVVGQESARLSTTPAWVDGRLEPRPYILRCYVARTGDGRWAVMPGAFSRISEEPQALAVSMQTGGRSSDVWVTSTGPVPSITLLPSPETIQVQRTTGTLPSRTAENMYWLGRYLERAEATLRVARALAGRLAQGEHRRDPVSNRLAEILRSWEAAPTHEGREALSREEVLMHAMRSAAMPGSVPAVVDRVMHAASGIRERLSTDTWRTLSELDQAVPVGSGDDPVGVFEDAQRALRVLAAVAGYVHENMTRLWAWRFLELGRRIERSLSVCRFTRRFAFDSSFPEGLGALLELVDSEITYRVRYTMPAPAPVLDLVLLDENNPRSVAFQVARIAISLVELPGHRNTGPLNPGERLAARMRTDLQIADPRSVTVTEVLAVERQLMDLSDVLSGMYFTPGRQTEPPP